MGFLLTDLRYAWRVARRSPGVTLAIIAMLALGTGGVTAIFNPIYSTLFAPLPFPQPEQLAIIGGNIPLLNVYFNKIEQKELDRFFSNLTTYAPFPATSVNIPDTGKIKPVYVADVSEDFFETLGVKPLRGSDFKHNEIKMAAVISNRFWRNEFMGAEDVIGKQIQIAFRGTFLVPIIGVMPESFDFPTGVDIWTYAGGMGTVNNASRQCLGRLLPGRSIGRAADELRAIEFKPETELQNHLNTMPEVASVGIFRPVPFSAEAVRAGQNFSSVYKTPRGEHERVSARIIEGHASPEGFEMLKLPLIIGRHFSSADMANELEFQIGRWDSDKDAPLTDTVGGVVIVNQSLARQFWPEENAVGKMIYTGLYAYEIVGVVRDFHQVGDNKNFVPAVYYPPDLWRPVNQTFMVTLHSSVLMKDFRRRISGFSSGILTIEAQSFGDTVSESTANIRMTIQLLGSFALLGIVVAGLGVYATTSIMAASWNREMGIRMAMGAQIWDILRLALWRGARAIMFGLPLGLFLAWILSRTLAGYLFLVKINDPLVWIISCALLLIITIIAAFIPSLRAARVNPLDALRND